MAEKLNTEALRVLVARNPKLLQRNPHLAELLGTGAGKKKIQPKGRKPSASRRVISFPPPEGILPLAWVCTKFTIPSAPMGKPRMTQSDKWNKRNEVVRYRQWADAARLATGGRHPDPIRVDIIAYLPIPKSHSAKLHQAKLGNLHRSKPDFDNISKGVCDALWKHDDSGIACGYTEKRWADDLGPRLELTVYHLKSADHPPAGGLSGAES